MSVVHCRSTVVPIRTDDRREGVNGAHDVRPGWATPPDISPDLSSDRGRVPFFDAIDAPYFLTSPSSSTFTTSQRPA